MDALRKLLPLAALLLLHPAPAAAQLAPLTAPRGTLRLDFGGRFDNWDERYRNGRKEPWATDFIRDPFDGSILTQISGDQAELRRVTGVQALTLSLGKSGSSVLVNLGTANLGAAYGVTSRLTLFGNVPIVRVRVQNTLTLDSTTATAGYNPSHPLFGDATRGAQTAAFLGQLLTAIGTVSDNLAAGQYDSDPVKKLLAQQTVAGATTMQADLEELFTGVVFLPLEGSAGAEAVTDPIDALRANFVTLGVDVLTASPAFPEGRLDSGALEQFVTDEEGPIAGALFPVPVLQYIGDIEVGAGYRWLDRQKAPGAGGLAIRSVLLATVRLRTGRLDNPARFFDVGTGERQPDLQGDLVTDLSFGKVGARLTGRYVYQFPGRQTRRLSPPDQPFAPKATTAGVERDPGEIVLFGIEPFLRIAPTLSLSAGIQHWSKAADKYSYVRNQDPIPEHAIDELAIDSKENGTLISLGVSFVHDGRRRSGAVGMPMDAFARVEKVVGSSLGRVPVRTSVAAGLRFYRKLF